jgi:hypothetical protein
VNYFGLLVCGVVAVGLSISPARQLIETSMVWHMAVQLPLLLLTGSLVGKNFPVWFKSAWLSTYNYQGLTGMLVVSIVLAYWMLPLAIDRALVHHSFDALKIISLIICGVMLYDFFIVGIGLFSCFF